MGIGYNVSIPLDSLELCLDAGNLKSYSGSGSSWNDLKTNTTFSGSNYATSEWANNILGLTICVVVEKTGNLTGYATHPVNKWNGGTGNASFVLYHFGSTGGEGNFNFYYTAGTTWSGQFVTNLTVGQKAHMVFQWNNTTGGQVWLNGAKVGGRVNSGILGVGGNGGIVISGPQSDTHTKVHHVAFYSRDLTDAEIVQHYRSVGKRFGL